MRASLLALAESIQYFILIYRLCSKIAVKEITCLTHPFHKTCLSLHKVKGYLVYL